MLSALVIHVGIIHLYVYCVGGLVCVYMRVRACVQVTVSARVFVFQCVSVLLCFV